MTERDWADDLYDAWLPDDIHWGRDWPMMRPWLTVRYDVAKQLQPKTIVEIGVRAGYSAFAFLSACPEAHYFGIDNYTYPEYSDMQTHYPHAAHLLRHWPNAHLILADSHALEYLPLIQADLVHVDGDHSYDGCKRDLQLCLVSDASYVLVDDTVGIPEVRQAVDDFIAKHHLSAELVDEGQQGAHLITFPHAQGGMT